MNKLIKYFDFTKMYFPIFWFPILLPMILALIGIITDITKISTNFVELMHNYNVVLTIVSKNSFIAFISTDIWSLTSIISGTAKKVINGYDSFALTFGIIIGLMVHILFYVIICFISFKYFYIPLCLMLVGFVGVIYIRRVVLSVEKYDFDKSSSEL